MNGLRRINLTRSKTRLSHIDEQRRSTVMVAADGGAARMGGGDRGEQGAAGLLMRATSPTRRCWPGSPATGRCSRQSAPGSQKQTQRGSPQRQLQKQRQEKKKKKGQTKSGSEGRLSALLVVAEFRWRDRESASDASNGDQRSRAWRSDAGKWDARREPAKSRIRSNGPCG